MSNLSREPRIVTNHQQNKLNDLANNLNTLREVLSDLYDEAGVPKAADEELSEADILNLAIAIDCLRQMNLAITNIAKKWDVVLTDSPAAN